MKKLRYYIDQLNAELAYLPKNLGYFFSKRKKAIYIGCTGHGNLGDEAILKAIGLLLKDDFFLYEILYTKPTSGKYLRRLLIKRPEYIILGGGTIIRKKSNESYLKILNNSINSWPAAKIAILGPGVAEPEFAEYIGFPLDIDGWKKFLNRAHFIGVRGVRSKKLLDSWQLKKDVHILHDPAIWYTRVHFNKKKKQKRIGLNFADIGNRIYGKNQDVIKQFAVSFVTKLQEDGWSVFLYPTTKSDLEYMLDIIGLKNFSGIETYSDYTDIGSSLDFLASMDVFVGQRLHAIIFAATVSTPFFALEYEPKTSDFLETIQLSNYSEEVDKLEVDTIMNYIKDIYANIDIEQSNLNVKMKEAKKEQQECLELFLNNK